MSTILFNEIIFGPIHSRRLGISLGINLLPYDGKICSFDCIYCECGFNKDGKTKTPLPSREQVKSALDTKLRQLKKQGIKPDVFTFAGNGEPTMHPHFPEIIDDTILLRDKYFPEAKISILTNAMHIGNDKIYNTLKKVDNNILKLDSAFIETVKILDRPAAKSYTIERQIELFKRFEGNFIMQTMFLKGSINGKEIDNTTDQEVSAWLEIVKQTNPYEVMIYTIDRETPEKSLQKASIEKLKEIALKVEQLGIKVIVAG